MADAPIAPVQREKPDELEAGYCNRRFKFPDWRSRHVVQCQCIWDVLEIVYIYTEAFDSTALVILDKCVNIFSFVCGYTLAQVFNVLRFTWL